MQDSNIIVKIATIMNSFIKATRWIISSLGFLLLALIFTLTLIIIPTAYALGQPKFLNSILDQIQVERAIATITNGIISKSENESETINDSFAQQTQTEILQLVLSNPQNVEELKTHRQNIIKTYYKAAQTETPQILNIELSFLQLQTSVKSTFSDYLEQELLDAKIQQYNSLPECTESPSEYETIGAEDLDCKIPGYQPKIDELDTENIQSQIDEFKTNLIPERNFGKFKIEVSKELAHTLHQVYIILQLSPILTLAVITIMLLLLIIITPSKKSTTIITSSILVITGLISIMCIRLIPQLTINYLQSIIDKNSTLKIEDWGDINADLISNQLIPLIRSLINKMTAPSLIISIIAVTIGILTLTTTAIIVKINHKKNGGNRHS